MTFTFYNNPKVELAPPLQHEQCWQEWLNPSYGKAGQHYLVNGFDFIVAIKDSYAIRELLSQHA